MSGHVGEHKCIRFRLLVPPSVHLSLFAYLHNSPFVCPSPSLSASQVGTVARQVSRGEYGQGRGDGWMDGTREGGREVGGMDR